MRDETCLVQNLATVLEQCSELILWDSDASSASGLAAGFPYDLQAGVQEELGVYGTECQVAILSLPGCKSCVFLNTSAPPC